MTDILVRGVPEPTLEILKRRAKEHRRSLQQEVLSIIERAAHEPRATSAAEVAAKIRSNLEKTGRDFGDSTVLVREDREQSTLRRPPGAPFTMRSTFP